MHKTHQTNLFLSLQIKEIQCLIFSRTGSWKRKEKKNWKYWSVSCLCPPSSSSLIAFHFKTAYLTIDTYVNENWTHCLYLRISCECHTRNQKIVFQQQQRAQANSIANLFLAFHSFPQSFSLLFFPFQFRIHSNPLLITCIRCVCELVNPKSLSFSKLMFANIRFLFIIFDVCIECVTIFFLVLSSSSFNPQFPNGNKKIPNFFLKKKMIKSKQ